MRKILLFVVASLALSMTNAMAQTATIRASVYDAETGEGLIGATVVVAGTSNGSVTDLDGKATLKLAPGTYDLQVQYVSYQTKTIEDVEVIANQVTTLEVVLAPETVGLEEVVVTAEAVKNTENALLTLQKKSPAVLDAISADMFARTGDNDAAAAVKRVTGVTVEGGKYVYVRGLGDRYSKSTLNGADIPGLDPNRNSVQLDLFPSNLIDNIIVYKTFSPELTGEFAGGLVNVTTKDFPDRFTMQAAASVGFNDQATFNNNYLTYNGSETDWLAFDNGVRELPQILDQYNNRNFPTPANPSASREQITEVSRSFDTNQFRPTASAPPLDNSFSFSLGNQKDFLKNPLGFIVGLTYRRDYDFYEGGTVNRYDGVPANTTTLEGALLSTVEDAASNLETSIGGLVNLSYKLGTNNKLSLNLMHNQAASEASRFQSGFSLNERPDSTLLLKNSVLAWTERALTNAQLKGEHNLPGLNDVSIDWFTSYTTSYLDEPDLRFLQHTEQIDNGDTLRRVSNINRPGRYFRNMEETNSDNRLNFTIPIKVWGGREGKVKFGGALTFKDRIFRERRFEYFLERGGRFASNVQELFQEERLGYDAEGNQRTYLDEVSQEGNNYDATQQVYASYLMLDAPLTEELRMTGGVRYERTDMDLEAFNGVTGNLETNDFLPALNLTYAIEDNTNMRVSYGRTIARPTFREFAPLVTFAFYGDFTQIGNANLERTLIDNFDLRWETYPSRGEYIGASAFYKHFNNPIENTVNPEAGGTTGEYKYENVDEGVIAGLELEFRKSLEFISPALEFFKIGLNGTYVYSRVSLEADELSAIRAFNPDQVDTRPMYNQSPFVINANLAYDNVDNGWSSNLTFNVFGERLRYFTTALPFIYEQPRPELNFTINKRINERLSARLRANNLLNPNYEEILTLDGNEFIFDQYTVGRSFSIGVSYLIE